MDEKSHFKATIYAMDCTYQLSLGPFGAEHILAPETVSSGIMGAGKPISFAERRAT